MARPAKSEIEVLRNLAWAVLPVAQAAARSRPTRGRRKAVAQDFPAAEGGTSTLFYKIADRGLPTPHLYVGAGRPGPVLEVEKTCPGSMRFFFHHFWLVIENADYPNLRTVYVMMSSLDGPIRKHLLRCIEGHDCSMRTDYVTGLLHALRNSGTLDSLTGALLLSQQAFCLCDDQAHDLIASYVTEHAMDWTCFGWMPPLLKEVMYVAVCLATLRCAPAHLDLHTAQVEAREQTMLLASETDPTWRLGDLLNDLKRAAAEIELPASDDSILTEKAKETLLERVLGRWADVWAAHFAGQPSTFGN
jgi:hypothetical protein